MPETARHLDWAAVRNLVVGCSEGIGGRHIKVEPPTCFDPRNFARF